MERDSQFYFRRWADRDGGGGWEGTGPIPDWAAHILTNDPDVLIDDRGVEVLHRRGESPAEFRQRCKAAAPPLTEEQKDEIRAASREYWAIVEFRERHRD